MTQYMIRETNSGKITSAASTSMGRCIKDMWHKRKPQVGSEWAISERESDRWFLYRVTPTGMRKLPGHVMKGPKREPKITPIHIEAPHNEYSRGEPTKREPNRVKKLVQELIDYLDENPYGDK